MYSDELKLTTDNQNNVKVLSRCPSVSHEIGSWICTTNSDEILNNLLQLRNVKWRLDFGNYSLVSGNFQCTTIKRTFETSDSEDGIFELNLTTDCLENCLLLGSSGYIGKTNESLVVENYNVLTSIPNRLDIVIPP